MGATPWLFEAAVWPQRAGSSWAEARHALLLLGILLLSTLDGLLTLRIVDTGVGWERNPLLSGVLARGAGPFLGVKLLLCGIAVALLWLARGHRWAPVVAVGGAVLYLGVVLYGALGWLAG